MLYYSNYTNYKYNYRIAPMNDEIDQTDIEILLELNQLNLDRICELEAKVEDLTNLIIGILRVNDLKV
jgi:hypothetical protein